MENRRKFLKAAGLAVVGSLIAGNVNTLANAANANGYFPLPANIFSDNISLLDRQTFVPLVNTTFAVARKKSPAVSLRLVEVASRNYKQKGLKKNTENFSLIFEAVGKERLNDEIYEMTHPKLGELSIFISEVGRSGKRYQAVFSRGV